MMALTRDIIDLFHESKVSITSSLVLSWFNPNIPKQLKTHWSAEGVGWILMQPADDEESQKATAHLKNTGEVIFDLFRHGVRLKPVAFGSCSYYDVESKYHYFTG